MIFIVNNKSICMRFYTSEVPLNSLQEPVVVGKNFYQRQIYEFIFDSCSDCRNMSAVPQGAFAVCKFQELMERRVLMQKPDIEEENLGGFFKKNLSEKQELTPLKYNSKLMNSIWGLYNRYSVHNLKKNTDPEGLLVKTLGNVLLSSTSSSASAKVPETSAEAHIL